MLRFFMTEYSVNGIKSIDSEVELSFCKKTINKDTVFKDYNVKGIYGINGSGKTGVITSVYILKNLLLYSDYLSDSVNKNNLNSLINKKTEELKTKTEFVVKKDDLFLIFEYEFIISKDVYGEYKLSYEKLSRRKANQAKENSVCVFECLNEEIVNLECKDTDFAIDLIAKSNNLLGISSLSSIFARKMFSSHVISSMDKDYDLYRSLLLLYFFASDLKVYTENSDDHEPYIKYSLGIDNVHSDIVASVRGYYNAEVIYISDTCQFVPTELFADYSRSVSKLRDFIKIFKKELIDIQIEKKNDKGGYRCSLIMSYNQYRINAEYESTGIKKLIKLFSYFRAMTAGNIVFIDELDSNLHDVYLCALLEFLMNFGAGQLCFTTHNVGPMDILKQNKKSIDFLNDNQIYPWIKNGNYSPSKLYREGMIEGSYFNVDSIDFISILLGDEVDF